MSTNVKNKKGLSFLFKKLSSDKIEVETPEPSVPESPGAGIASRHHATRSNMKSNRAQNRMSAGNLQELIRCPLCLEKFVNPKMLPCQHTFCYPCIKIHAADKECLECPVCWEKFSMDSVSFVDKLPSNLYIDSILSLVNIPSIPKEPVAQKTLANSEATNVELIPATSNLRCANCKTMCDVVITKSCGHCKQSFCSLCWAEHMDDLKTQIGAILKQLDSATNRLNHKVEHFHDCCDKLKKQIDIVTEEKVNGIMAEKHQLMQEAQHIQKKADLKALGLRSSLGDARASVLKAMNENDHQLPDDEKIQTFLNLHRSALAVITDVSKWEGDRFIFDRDSFKIDTDTNAPSETDEPIGSDSPNELLDGEDKLIMHYRARNFQPHYVWKKTPRPSGVACSPWNDLLYICGVDSHSVFIIERTHAKVIGKLSCEEMLCPVHIAFLKSRQEIYVTDKWRHCVLVFGADCQFLRSIGSKGSRLGQFRSPEGIAIDNSSNLIYVVDTGNDRVQILRDDGSPVGLLGVITKSLPGYNSTIWHPKDAKCNEFNAPTDVALYGDRVIVLDGGNKRVKIFNKNDKSKVHEFGSFGTRKGQFRQPEVLAVDPSGFIAVGDSGNARVQIFKPNGNLVRVFGGSGNRPGRFGWISGMFITEQLDFIISDTKNHSVYFF